MEDEKTRRMILKLEGALTAADARLLEEICADLKEDFDYGITIDFAGVNFVGRQSAAILCRLKETPDLTMEGMHLFVQQIMDSTEAAQRNGKEGDGE
jgi:anti-anti-sigma regulatory factor